jgi:hypothetical protein
MDRDLSTWLDRLVRPVGIEGRAARPDAHRSVSSIASSHDDRPRTRTTRVDSGVSSFVLLLVAPNGSRFHVGEPVSAHIARRFLACADSIGIGWRRIVLERAA